MNCFAAYTVPVIGGFWAMCRFAQNAKPWPLMDEDKPKVFPVRSDALIAAQGHVIQHINGTMRRDGAVLEARSKADALFNLNPTIKQRGKQRPITVERREKRV